MATIVPTTFSGSLSGTIGTINAGDIVVIPSESSVPYTTGLDLSASEIGGFYISKGCTSTFGSASAGGVLIDMDQATYTTAQFVHEGSASAYIDPATAIARTRKIGPGDLYGLGGTWTTVEHAVGYSSFNDTADVVTLYQFGGSVFIDEHASETLDTSIVGTGAQLTCKRNLGAATVYGRLTQPERAVTITTLTIAASGVAYHAGSTITTLNGYHGTLDLSGCSNDITITTANIYSKDFKIIAPPAPWALTITNENYFGDAVKLGV